METPPTPTSLEFRQLERDIPSLYLINGLYLTMDQARQLARVMEESRALGAATQEEVDRFLQRNQRNLDQLLDELVRSSDREFKEAKPIKSDLNRLKQLKNVRHEWHKILGDSEKQFTELAEKAWQTLTDAQRDILDRFTPCFIPPSDFRTPERVGQAAEDTSHGQALLSRLRSSAPDAMCKAKTNALDTLLSHAMRQRQATLTENEMTALRKKLETALNALIKKIRKMKDADFELEKARLVEQLLKLDEKEKPKSIHQQTQEHLNKIKTYLLNPGNLEILNARGGVETPGMKSDPMLMAGLYEKGKPFRAAGLLGDLQLTSGQSRQLLPIVSEAVAERDTFEKQLEAIRANALEPYRQLKRELAAQQSAPASEKIASQFHQRTRQVLDKKITACLIKNENRLDRILSADQVEFLIGGKTKNKTLGLSTREAKKDITQFRDRARKVFDTIDALNAVEFDRQKHALCQAFVESCVNTTTITQADIDVITEIDRAEQLLTRARTTGQFDYGKAREDFIAELCPRRHSPRPPKFGWRIVMGEPLEILNPTTQLIFTSCMLGLIEKKANNP